MDTEAITVIVTVVLAVFAIIWHQQRSAEKLRSELTFKTDKLDERFFGALGSLRNDFNQANCNLRIEFNQANSSLRDEVVANGQRLARIEGFFRIGVPAYAVDTEPSPAEPTAAPEPATDA